MAVRLSPFGNQQFVTETGAPANGWLLYTYIAGSSTPIATYTDATGTVPQSNPIVLNTLGFPTNGQIWLTSGTLTKFQLTDSVGNVKKTEDNVSGINDSANNVTQWVSSGLTPTYISATSFSLSGDQTVDFHPDRRLQFLVTAGTVYGFIRTSTFSASITTITMQMDLATVLDTGLSTANLSILRADHTAVPIGATPIRSAAITSSQSAIDLTLDTNIFEAFELIFTGLIPATTGDTLIIRAFVAGVIQTTAIYSFSTNLWTSASSATSGGVTSTVLQLSTAGSVSNNAGAGGISGRATLFNAANTSANKHLTAQCVYFGTSGDFLGVNTAAEMSIQNAALSGIRIYFGASNIASGTISLFGYKRAT